MCLRIMNDYLITDNPTNIQPTSVTRWTNRRPGRTLASVSGVLVLGALTNCAKAASKFPFAAWHQFQWNIALNRVTSNKNEQETTRGSWHRYERSGRTLRTGFLGKTQDGTDEPECAHAKTNGQAVFDTLVGDALVEYSCKTLLQHSCGTLSWDTLLAHSCGALLWDSFVARSWGTLLRDRETL